MGRGRLLGVLSLVLLLAAIAGCATQDSDASSELIGSWDLVATIHKGEESAVADGKGYSIELLADGSATWIAGPARWFIRDDGRLNVTQQDGSFGTVLVYPWELNGDRLTIDESQVFERR